MATLASLLSSHGTVRTYRAKAPIAFQGEIPREAFLVLDGAVRSYTINASGEERIMSIYGKGSIFFVELPRMKNDEAMLSVKKPVIVATATPVVEQPPTPPPSAA